MERQVSTADCSYRCASPTTLGAPIGPGWLQPVFVGITALGGVTALTHLTISVVGYLLAAKKWISATLVAAATISGSLLGHILKPDIARAPDDCPALR